MTSQETEFAFVYQGQVIARFTLQTGEYFIGSEPGCKIAIEIDGIAPRHARLVVGERLVVEDLGSELGTFLDGQRLSEPVELETGAAVQLGTAGALRVESRPVSLTRPPLSGTALPSELNGADSSHSRLEAAADAPEWAAAEAANQAAADASEQAEAEAAARLAQAAADAAKQAAEWAAAEAAERAATAAAAERARRAKALERSAPKLNEATISEAKPREAIVATPGENASGAGDARVEIQRLREGLVEEMNKRRLAERRFTELLQERASAQPSISPTTPTKAPSRAWPKWSLITAAVVTFGLADEGMTTWVRKRADEAKVATLTIKTLRPAADQFATTAEDFVERGDWTSAIQQLQYALTLVSEHAAWRCRLGDLWMAQFNFENALAAYRKAASHDARLADAASGIAVCERLIRAKEQPGSLSVSALYAVHRTMMSHGRLAEAVRVAAQLADDADLQQRTWQERLQKGGLDADVRLDESRRLTVQLRGKVQARLSLLRGISAVALRMPETDVTDLQPLAGLPLEELDLSQTMVAKVDALRGMPLRRLNLNRSQVEDIFPLRGLPLEELRATRTLLRSISALRNMPLRKLDISHTKVADLQALATLPLWELDASHTLAVDLSPLAHLPLRTVRLDDTKVIDLSPLRGGLVTELSLARTPITSIEALAQMPIAILSLSGCSQLRDLQPLSKLPDLQKLIPPSGSNPNELQALIPKVRFAE